MSEIASSNQVLISIRHKKVLADQVTPVGLYLKLREHYEKSVLLESNDFQAAENSYSLIGVDPIAGFHVQNGMLKKTMPNQAAEQTQLSEYNEVPVRFKEFMNQFKVSGGENLPISTGFFGHTSFDGIQYFENIKFDQDKRKMEMADMQYWLYRFIIVIDHFRDEMHLIEHQLDGEKSQLERFERLLNITQVGDLSPFNLTGEEGSNLTDDAFMELVRKGKHHCQVGDVFQIVFARQYYQSFSGDDFQVYRVLRSINPSPYLFYFDYGEYKIFGSSPEAQLKIKDGIAEVNPIAGTYRRTGNDEEDRQKAAELALDPKENAEHIMLVDLARNDLGKHATEVEVNKLKEIQYFSHVIHLVSNVVGKLRTGYNPIQVFGDSFPAGTLSGAPKYKALELISEYENQNRGFYGGGIGYIGLDGSMNQAIVIRSFLSRDNVLYSQAGAGVVVDSNPEKELMEVNHKLGALKKALMEAEKLS